MPIIHSKPVFFKYQFITGESEDLEIEIHGEELFTYYVSWDIKNMVKINIWAKEEYVDELNKEREKDFRKMNVFIIKLNNKEFYIMLPYFFKIYQQSGRRNVICFKFIHDRCQKLTNILTEEMRIFTSPKKPQFTVEVNHKNWDENNKPLIIIRNRNGRIFCLLRGFLDLACFTSMGILKWMKTYRFKKDIRKK